MEVVENNVGGMIREMENLCLGEVTRQWEPGMMHL